MKAFMKVAKAAIVSGIVLSSVLMTTGCSTGNQPAAPTSAPVVSQSAVAPTPTPTPTPSATTAATIGPWGINIDDVVANHLDKSVAEVYPNETQADIKEGVLFALNNYQGLVNKKNFYRARTASDNTLLFPDADKFDKTFYDAMTARTTANGGRFVDIITFGKADGSISKDLIMDPTKDVFFKGEEPTVYAGDTKGQGNVFVVKANATMYAPTADSKVVEVDLHYWIGVTHAGPGKWLVSDLGYKIDNSAITDSVAAPKAPNAK